MDADTAGGRTKQASLGSLLMRAAAAHRLRTDRALEGLDLTPPQYAVLSLLAASPGASNADVARASALTPQTVSVILANLIRAGLISRRPHAQDGRIAEITLTVAGTSLLGHARLRTLALEVDLLSDLGEADQAFLRGWLAKTAGNDEHGNAEQQAGSTRNAGAASPGA